MPIYIREFLKFYMCAHTDMIYFTTNISRHYICLTCFSNFLEKLSNLTPIKYNFEPSTV